MKIASTFNQSDFQIHHVQTATIQNIVWVDSTANTVKPANLLIRDGKKIEVVSVETAPLKNFPVIDGKGYIACPAWWDLASTLPDPNNPSSGNVEAELKLAEEGGFAQVTVWPTSSYPLDTPAEVRLLQQTAKNSALMVTPIVALTRGLAGERPSDFAALKKEGCFITTQSSVPMTDLRVQARCLEYAATHHLKVFFQSIESSLAVGGYMHEGEVSDILGIPGIPVMAETIAVMRDLELAKHAEVQPHISQISCERTLNLLHSYGSENISADVSIFHLCFTEQQLINFDSRFRVTPPLRTESDRLALIAAVRDGQLAISSGHQPRATTSKMAPFANTASGAATFDVFLALGCELIRRGELSWPQWVKATSALPRKILNNYTKSEETTYLALDDFCLIDPDAQWDKLPEFLQSLGGDSGITGFRGKVKARVRLIPLS
ncbi:MAG: hypothetical protein V4629_01095 [Pseudomonadota bacterium]